MPILVQKFKFHFGNVIQNNRVIFFYLFIYSFQGITLGDNSQNVIFKQLMRNFVMNISQYARSINPNFIIIPQNGVPIITNNGDLNATVQINYLNAINAWGQEDLLYGYDSVDVPTTALKTSTRKPYLDLAKSYNKTILITDYCTTPSFVNNSYAQNFQWGYISLATTLDLSSISSYPVRPFNENSNNISTMNDAKNFLYLINPSSFSDTTSLLKKLMLTNYDVIILDAFRPDNIIFNSSQINSLKVKSNGGKRLVVAYMSIGEAENYRYYWLPTWKIGNPSFIVSLNPDWPGDYKVQYWDPTWQSIIFGNNNSYTKKILNAGFDGAYLDIIDGYEYFESKFLLFKPVVFKSAFRTCTVLTANTSSVYKIKP